MADHDDTLRRLDAIGVGRGWTCLLAGPGTEDLLDPLRDRIGPKARLVVAGEDLPDAQFDFVLARGESVDLGVLAGRLWFGGLLLLEIPGADGPALTDRLVAVGLGPVGHEPGAAHARRPQFITSY
jgi:hypothetical protein